MSRFIFTPKALRKNAALRPEDYFGGNSEPWGKTLKPSTSRPLSWQSRSVRKRRPFLFLRAMAVLARHRSRGLHTRAFGTGYPKLQDVEENGERNFCKKA